MTNPPRPPKRAASRSVMESHDLDGLMHRLAPVFDSAVTPIISCVASLAGEGTSTTVRDFAHHLAAQSDRRVLMVEIAPPQTSTLGLAEGIVDARTAGHAVTEAVTATQNANVFYAIWARDTERTTTATKHIAEASLWDDLRQAFDIILIDAPSLQRSADGIALARQANATLLIVAAETTRKHVVEHARDTLQEAGAHLAGVIFTKRRMYIPARVYKRL